MAKKRKRMSKEKNVITPQKRAKTEDPKIPKQKKAVSKNEIIQTDLVQHPVLSHYFPNVFPLRAYLLHLLAIDSSADEDAYRKYSRLKHFSGGHCPEGSEVNDLLDYAVVGLPTFSTLKVLQEKEFSSSSQHDDTYTRSSEIQKSSQSDLINWIIAKLFHVSMPDRPTSILTLGYRETCNSPSKDPHGTSTRFGLKIVNKTPNRYVQQLKGPTWRKIMDLVGEKILIKLLSVQGDEEGAVFCPVRAYKQFTTDVKCYYQIAGTPLPDVTVGNWAINAKQNLEMSVSERIKKLDKPVEKSKMQSVFIGKGSVNNPDNLERPPGRIVFARNRIFSAKPALNSKLNVKFGLRHIHVLNRFSNSLLRSHKIHVLKYMFPREFGLHNVFTSSVKANETKLEPQDYTLREEEIAEKFRLESIKDYDKNIPSRHLGSTRKQNGGIERRVMFEGLDSSQLAFSSLEAGDISAYVVPEHISNTQGTCSIEDIQIIESADENDSKGNDSTDDEAGQNKENGTSQEAVEQQTAKMRRRAHRDKLRKDQKAKIEQQERTEDVPKRLRGQAYALIGKLMKMHRRCSYDALLKYYCPVTKIDKSVPETRPMLPNKVSPVKTQQSTEFKTQFSPIKTRSLEKPSSLSTDYGTWPAESTTQSADKFKEHDVLIDFASSSSHVSAFIRAVLKDIIPQDFFGEGSGGLHNMKLIFDKVDHFIKLRRGENMCLHEVLQGIKIMDIGWLNSNTTKQRQSNITDIKKRHSLFSEFIYYLFDSILIPLLRSHFYITQTTSHRMRVFYFRHDVWKRFTEPQMIILKDKLFEEMQNETVQRVINSRKLGCSTIRLVPKEKGVRMITNLRKKPFKSIKDAGVRTYMSKSINEELRPLFNALKCERKMVPSITGAAMFSTQEIHPRLKIFKETLQKHGFYGESKLYFVKVDITSAFDSLPQDALLAILRPLIQPQGYKTHKICEVREDQQQRQSKADPHKKWIFTARRAKQKPELDQLLTEWMSDGRAERRHTVFVDKIDEWFKSRAVLVDLLEEHIKQNFIQIGKKFYRQKTGIAQGSIISNLACNILYADLEATKLAFTREPTGILLRMTDDFLFITLKHDHAIQFLETMHGGLPEYGAQVKSEKSLINFDAIIHGHHIKRTLTTDPGFPYCGFSISDKTLDIKRDRERNSGMNIADTLSVVYSTKAGEFMAKRLVNGFKLSCQPMLFDPQHNSRYTVLTNLFSSFLDQAMKLYRYVRAINASRPVGGNIIIDLIQEITSSAYGMFRSRLGRDVAKDADIDTITSTTTNNKSGNKNQGKNKKGKKNKSGGGCSSASSNSITLAHIQWLSATAYKRILTRKQTSFKDVLAWLDSRLTSLQVDRSCRRMVKSRAVIRAFDSYKY